MIIRRLAGSPLAGLVASALLQGCVQYPTETHSVVDQRPRISFRYADARLDDARLVVDGLDAGRMGDFAEGRTTLRLITGTHSVRIITANTVVFEESFYVGDGVTRAIIVK